MLALFFLVYYKEHWTLVVVSLKEKTIWIFSMKLWCKERVDKAKAWLEAAHRAEGKKFIPKEWKCIYRTQSPVIQTNNFDCGAYLCLNLCGALRDLLSKPPQVGGRFSFSFIKRDIPRYRDGIANIVITGGTDDKKDDSGDSCTDLLDTDVVATTKLSVSNHLGRQWRSAKRAAVAGVRAVQGASKKRCLKRFKADEALDMVESTEVDQSCRPLGPHRKGRRCQ